MSFETQVLVDGVWRAQRIDVQTVLDCNRNKKIKEPEVTVPAPSLAILKQTVSRSPMAKWIIPARIRNRDKNDVIFVGESFVQIKEILFDGRLQDIAVKNDFEGRIKHARVLGNRREPAAASSNTYQRIVEDDSNLLAEDISGAADDLLKVPPHVLVLSVDDGFLHFLFAFETENGEVEFITTTKTVVNHRDVEDHGRQIAVDPRSRAMALAATRNHLTLYALHPMGKAVQNIESNGALEQEAADFLEQERHIVVDGEIMKMEFLYPASNDRHHVILLLVVSQHERTRLLVYEWDCGQKLGTAKKQGALGLPVADHDREPLLLIPLTIASAFLLVSKSAISAYTGILTGTVQRKFVVTISDDPSDDANRLSETPVCTSWARPVRTLRHSEMHDSLYIAREDGLIRYVEIDQQDQLLIKTTSKAGNLQRYIGTAFASLDVGMNSNDLLIAGGDTSNGGIYSIQAKSDAPQLVQVIPNWTPIVDAVIVDPSSRQVEPNKFGIELPYDRGRLFACTGSGLHGAVTEIRYGLKAWIDIETEYRRGARRMWCLVSSEDSEILLMFSYLSSTEIINLSSNMRQLERKNEADSMDFAFADTTLVAGVFGSYIIQVASRSIRIISGASEINGGEETLKYRTGRDKKIVEAALDTEMGLVFIAVRGPKEVQLHSVHLRPKEDPAFFINANQPIVLRSDPAHLSILLFGERTYIVVCTTQETLQIYEDRGDKGILPVAEYEFNTEDFKEEFAVCDGLAPLQINSDWDSDGFMHVSLACGLRNGFLVILCLKIANMDHATPVIDSRRTIRIGTAPARVIPDSALWDGAFLMCGKEFCRIRLENIEGVVQIWSMWLTKTTEPEFQQRSTSLVARFPLTPWSTPGVQAQVACLSGETLMIFGLDEIQQEVPRHVTIGGTPQGIMYSRHLDLLIAAYSKPTRPSSALSAQRAYARAAREFVSSLKLVHPDHGLLAEHSYRIEFKGTGNTPQGPKETAPTSSFAKLGERILKLIEWTCTVADKKHYFIALGTSLVDSPSPSQLARGRVIVLSVKRTAPGQLRLVQNFTVTCTMPVACLAPFGPRSATCDAARQFQFSGEGPLTVLLSSLIVCGGEEVCLRSFNEANRTLERVCAIKLRSPAVDMSVSEPLIYVSTKSHSLNILKVKGTQMFQVFNDNEARLTDNHLLLPKLCLTLVSDQECTLSGLWQDRDTLIKCVGREHLAKAVVHRELASGETLFEAQLPANLTRLLHGTILPTWWRQVQVPGIIREEAHHDEARPKHHAFEILGLSADGSIYRLRLLTDAAYDLLRFVEDRAVSSASISSLLVPGDVDEEIMPRSSHSGIRQIDGDLLSRFVKLGSSHFRQVFEPESESEKMDEDKDDLDSPSAAFERLDALVEMLYGTRPEDPVAVAMEYLRATLCPTF